MVPTVLDLDWRINQSPSSPLPPGAGLPPRQDVLVLGRHGS